MQTAPATAQNFPTHFVGRGIDDDRHVVEKYQSLAYNDRVRGNIPL